MKLSTRVTITELLKEVCKFTDYQLPQGDFVDVVTDIPEFSLPKKTFGLGIIVGRSGAGKTTILKSLGDIESPIWDENKSVVDHFDSFEDASNRLGASGLNSIPAWIRPYHTLSNGEQYRADISRKVRDGAVIDEFTSVVDRNVAKSCSVALSKYIKRFGITGVVLSSCHYDVVEWLQPDWVYDCNVGYMVDRGLVRRPPINIELIPCNYKAWSLFSQHHYLTGNINKSSRCWLAVWENTLVGFASAISFPNGNIKNAWRGHRTVILPEFQGMGIGSKVSDAVGEIFIHSGCRYFSKTAHPTLGNYREGSIKWKPTSKNRKARPDYKANRVTKEDGHKMAHAYRLCFSHEYVGESK